MLRKRNFCETDLLKAADSFSESKSWKLNKMLGSKRSVTPSLGDGRNKNKFSSVSLQGQASTSSGGPDPGSKYKKHHSASSIPGPTTHTFILLFCLFWVVYQWSERVRSLYLALCVAKKAISWFKDIHFMKSVCEKKKQNALVTIVVGSPTSGCAVDRLCTFWRRSYGGWKAAVPRKQCLQSAGPSQRFGNADGSTRLVSDGCLQGWTVSEHIRRI